MSQGLRQPELLLLHSGALGDFVLAYRFACGLLEDPGRQLAVVARHSVVAWFAARGLAAEGHRDEAVGLRELYGADAPPNASIAEFIRRFGAVVSLLGGPESVVGRGLGRIHPTALACIDAAADGSTRHITKQWADRLGRSDGWQYRPPPRGPLLVCREQEHERLRARCGGRSGKVLIIHPGSGSRAKCAPLESFMEVQRGAARRGWQVLWMIGPDEIERDGRSLLDRLPAGKELVCEPSIADAADVLAGGDAFCGNDSGMAHLAAAIGLNTVVWFGPTDPAVWRPLGPRVTVLGFTLASAPVLVQQTLEALEG